MMDIIFTVLLNALPIIILIVPLFFIWKKTIGKLYFRICIGIIVFYLIYWIMPIIFQIGAEPDELVLEKGEEGNIALGIGYIIAHIGSLIALFASYPLVTLPFIFLVAPFISMIFVWNHLRKEDGTIKENLMQVTYEYNQSPFSRIREELDVNSWTREKEILKLMIVLLPISLYLLQVILDISNLQNVSLTEGSTALGWFLEILFVYLAIFIFSIELLFSSQIALKGRYFGENVREQTYRSLYSVGAPISILSLILFILQYGTSIFIIIYFFAYFIMASIIFILFIDIFEPISILLFVKLIDAWKNKKEKRKDVDRTKLLYGIVFGFIAFFIFILIDLLLLQALYATFFSESVELIIESSKYGYQNPTLFNSMAFDLMNIYTFLVLVVLPIIIASLLLLYAFKYTKSIFSAIISFLPIIIGFSLLFFFLQANPLIHFSHEEYWLTGRTSYTTIFGYNFYTLRTASFDAALNTPGGLSLLGILAIPYIYLRYIVDIVFWSLIFYYIGKDFKIIHLPIDDKMVEKAVYSSVGEFLTKQDYIEGKTRYLISKVKEPTAINVEQERDEVKNLLNVLEKDTLLENLVPEDYNEKKRFYFTLKYLHTNNLIKIWEPEFSFRFERVEKQGLYVIYNDGRDIFNYPFIKESTTDPALISGMFSAITSFITETTHSTQLLRTIDHGDISILLEYSQKRHFFTALFIKGKQSAEVRAQLKEFVNKFEAKHVDVLVSWSGILAPFREDHLLVEEIFTEI